jgi:hypothetical protein
VDLAAFERELREMCAEIPVDYFDGVTEVVASPRVVPHPERPDIFTLGECIPLPLGEGDWTAVQSRIVLYHGSFRALADLDPDFDWRGEAWETLTHELRHHVEWRAQQSALEDFDQAAEANFARQGGDPFDPLFYLDGAPRGEGLYQVGDDWFIDRQVGARPGEVTVPWQGRSWRVALPADATVPTYLSVTGVTDPPPGELIVVVRWKPRLRDLLRAPPRVSTWTVAAVPQTSEE